MSTIPKLYLKGTFNGWGLDTPFHAIDDHQFQADVILSADCHHIKVTDMDGTKEWTFTGHPIDAVPLIHGTPITLVATQGIGNDLLFTPQQTGRFSLILDLADLKQPTLTVSEPIAQPKHANQRPSFHQAIAPVCGAEPTLEAASHTLAEAALFEQLKIQSHTAFPFVFGDSVDGYYEGQTHCFTGLGRYRHHQGWFLGSFASLIDNNLLDKTAAEHATLWPFGIEHQFNNGATDRLSLFSGQRMVSLQVTATQNGHLALVPELNIGLNDCDISVVEQTLVIEIKPELCPEGAPTVIAISANQAFVAQELERAQSPETKHPELDSHLNLNPNNLKLQLSSQQASQNFIVYLAFEHNKAQAIQAAQQAALTHGDRLHQHSVYQYLTNNYLWTNDLEYNRAVMWARLASRTFVNREFGTGIWAGLPWFKDCWGRDTFITFPGACLVNGQWQDAKDIISDFAAMQMDDISDVNHGRVPNRVTSKTNIIYNTTDGTPWMIREIMEYINYSGDLAFAKQIFPVVKRFVQGVEAHYLDNDGLMRHRDPDTWMDAKINGEIPWSPRGPKANDIEALWFESLNVSHQLALWNQDTAFAEHCLTLAEQVKTSFVTKFWNEETHTLADHLSANDVPDNSIRPNQLMTLTIPTLAPLVADDIGQHIVKNSVDHLLFPWGICSLQQEHIDFHPYHDKRAEYHKDAAYHNGTIWGWNAGFTVSALTRFAQQDFAYSLSKNLAKQILEQGHRGTMSENLDAFQDNPEALIESGTYAQAWSVAEYARNAQQDYLGFAPKLVNNTLELTPHLPTAWRAVTAKMPFGDNALLVDITKQGDVVRYVIKAETAAPEITLQLTLHGQAQRLAISHKLNEELCVEFNTQTDELVSANQNALVQSEPSSHYPLLDNLTFATPDRSRQYAALAEQNYLLNKRSQQSLTVATDA